MSPQDFQSSQNIFSTSIQYIKYIPPHTTLSLFHSNLPMPKNTPTLPKHRALQLSPFCTAAWPPIKVLAPSTNGRVLKASSLAVGSRLALQTAQFGGERWGWTKEQLPTSSLSWGPWGLTLAVLLANQCKIVKLGLGLVHIPWKEECSIAVERAPCATLDL